jgi:enamine deaminase RidA (YjgF/YER057c/UK114 family)
MRSDGSFPNRFQGKLAMTTIERRLAALNIVLPEATLPAANYLPYIASGNLLYLSGQLPTKDGHLVCVGKLGDELTTEDGYAGARLCAINLIVQIKAAIGDLAQVRRIVRLGGFVNSTASFIDQPKVINGASDLFVGVFGDAGRHARSAVACPSLPFGAGVEVDAIVEVIGRD